MITYIELQKAFCKTNETEPLANGWDGIEKFAREVERIAYEKILLNAPRLESLEADFEKLTWTFQITPGCRVGGGTYALAWIPNNGLGRTPLRTAGEPKMNILTREQMEEILSDKLAKDHPGWSVECGENWELIAEIFYKAGFDAASAN